ncbi:hypothetical protein TPA0909_37020 [Streptomyces albus]|nr:hypothetical protein TPA0909_37020 [Streptomyces albus]
MAGEAPAAPDSPAATGAGAGAHGSDLGWHIPRRGISWPACGHPPPAGRIPYESEEWAMSTVTTTYKVSGMTCGHCEGAVTEEISRIEGVSSVKAVAASGEVTVTSAADLDDAAVREAVDEAGYALVGRA